MKFARSYCAPFAARLLTLPVFVTVDVRLWLNDVLPHKVVHGANNGALVSRTDCPHDFRSA